MQMTRTIMAVINEATGGGGGGAGTNAAVTSHDIYITD